ncbi:MAG: hypothetical protein ED859_01905 [Desulfuromonadales bacterium]|nr:MAG: hypothetical protein ED859_01905 [Desulfuromonadales bacterium]
MVTRSHLTRNLKRAFLIAAGLACLPVTAMATEVVPLQDKGVLAVEAADLSRENRELVQLFSPTIRNREVRVNAGKEGAKVLTIVTDSILTGRTVRKFNESLLAKGVSIYGAAYYGNFSWERTINDAAITATRTVTGEMDTIEISEGIVRDPKTNLPLMPLTVSIHELSIPLRDDFGKTWKKMRIIPDAETAAPEPKTGRYPGSRVRLVRQNDEEKRHVVYAVKGNLRQVEEFFDAKLKEAHRTVIVAGDSEGAPSPAEVFGIRTSAQVVVLSGYTYSDKKLAYTEVTLRRASDPNLAPYVEVEVAEN